MAEAAALTTKESMFSLSEEARNAAAARQATRLVAAAAGGKVSVASAAEHELSLERGVDLEDDARADFEGAGLVWAYSFGQRATVVVNGETKRRGGALPTSIFRRLVATASV